MKAFGDWMLDVRCWTFDVSVAALRRSKKPGARAFTLIEMLVVLVLIGIVAGLIVGLAAGASARGKQSRVRTGLVQLETAIEHYKEKLGYYPPDNAAKNPPNYAVHQLFYELTGTTNSGGGLRFHLFNGQVISAATANTAFNRKSFANSSAENERVQNFFTTIRPAQYKEISSGGGTVFVLVVPVSGPNPVPAASGEPVNTWNYNSSNPVHNREAYDLWADILIGGKTFRICNWSKIPIPNPQPYP